MHKLPSYIRFLITTRPEKNIIDKFKQLNPLYLECKDERNVYDVKLVFEKKILKADSLTEDLLNSLAKKSDGLMLYAFFLSQMYNKDSVGFSIDSFPNGIDYYYGRYCERLKGEFKHVGISADQFLTLLNALAVAQGPLPAVFVNIIFDTGSSQWNIQSVQKTISSLLFIDKDKSVSFFHKSLRDWLIDSTDHVYSVNVQDAHETVLNLCIRKLNSLKDLDAHVASTDLGMKYSVMFFLLHMLNTALDSTTLEKLVIHFVCDLQIVFAAICVNVDVSLTNLTRLMAHEIFRKISVKGQVAVKNLFFLVRKFAFLLRNYLQTFLQHVVNEGGEEFSLKATELLETRYQDIIYLESIDKTKKFDALEYRCLLSGTISGIDVSPEYKYVVCSYREGGIELFSLTVGKSLWKLSHLEVERPLFPSLSSYLGRPVMLPHCIVFHPVENLIFPGRLDKALTLEGKLKTGLFQCDESSAKFTNCCFSSDNSKMVTNYRNELIVWNLLSGTKEHSFQGEALFSFSFTASGNFLAVVDIENVFKVFDTKDDYTVVRSIKIISQSPVEIISAFEENSWFCLIHDIVKIVNHDFTSPDLSYASQMDVILPSSFYCSNELQCLLLLPKLSLSRKIKRFLNDAFMWSSYTALRFFVLGDNSLLIYSCSSNAMHVFSISVLKNVEEPELNRKGVFSSLSSNGNFAYFNNTWENRFTVCNVVSKTKQYPDPSLFSNQLDIPVVKDGVILYDKNRAPELWNTVVTHGQVTFDLPAGARKCLPVSDELIAILYESSVVFFNVFTKTVESKTVCNEPVRSVYACSIKYHVFAQTESCEFSLWKKGNKVVGWEDVFSANTQLRCVLFANFSPDGNRLALFSVEINKIFIFDVSRVAFLAQVLIDGPANDFLRLKFFDNENLVCGSSSHMLYIVNAERGEIITCLDVGDIPAPIDVSRDRSIVFAANNFSERFELIRLWLPR